MTPITALRLSSAGLAALAWLAACTSTPPVRTHVVVGDLPDRPSAQTLAQQLRDVLRQDVALFRW